MLLRTAHAWGPNMVMGSQLLTLTQGCRKLVMLRIVWIGCRRWGMSTISRATCGSIDARRRPSSARGWGLSWGMWIGLMIANLLLLKMVMLLLSGGMMVVMLLLSCWALLRFGRNRLRPSRLIGDGSIFLFILQPFPRFFPLGGMRVHIEVIFLPWRTRVTDPFTDFPFLNSKIQIKPCST